MAKKTFFYLQLLLIFGCIEKNNQSNFCLDTFEYKCYKNRTIPDQIVLKFKDKNQMILKKLKTDYITKIIFFDSKELGVEFSYGHLISSKDSVVLQFGSGYFSREINKKEWTSKEVENLLLKDSIGLIYKKDTLIVKCCN